MSLFSFLPFLVVVVVVMVVVVVCVHVYTCVQRPEVDIEYLPQ